jgi:hypothetical protein
MARKTLLVATASMLAVVLGATSVVAAGKGVDEITKPYHMKVIGASMADQLATGLLWEFKGDKLFRISQSTKAATGLVRADVYNWQDQLEEIVKDDNIDIIVVALGGNDRQSFFHKRRRLRRFSVLWRAEYLRRLQKFMRTLTSNVPVVYWVGLPIVRSARATNDYNRLNRYFRDVGGPLGVRYLDIYDKFANEAGKYTSYGKSLAGRKRRLRQRDGVHFTMAGARVLGKVVGDLIRADLNARKLGSKNAANDLRSTLQ